MACSNTVIIHAGGLSYCVGSCICKSVCLSVCLRSKVRLYRVRVIMGESMGLCVDKTAIAAYFIAENWEYGHTG